MPGKKPTNATWIAKTTLDPTNPNIDYPLDGPSAGNAPTVVLYWHPSGKVKVVLQGAGPCVISQAFLPGKGQDVIVELAPAAPTTLPSPDESVEGSG